MIQLRYMGDDLVLLTGPEGVDIDEILSGSEDWLSEIFDVIHAWAPTSVPNHRITRVRCSGIPLHMWTRECFANFVAPLGEVVRIAEETSNKSILEYARIQIRTPCWNIISHNRRFCIRGVHYNILIAEEYGGEVHSCCCKDSSMQDDESRSRCSQVGDDDGGDESGGSIPGGEGETLGILNDFFHQAVSGGASNVPSPDDVAFNLMGNNDVNNNIPMFAPSMESNQEVGIDAQLNSLEFSDVAAEVNESVTGDIEGGQKIGDLPPNLKLVGLSHATNNEDNGPENELVHLSPTGLNNLFNNMAFNHITDLVEDPIQKIDGSSMFKDAQQIDEVEAVAATPLGLPALPDLNLQPAMQQGAMSGAAVDNRRGDAPQMARGVPTLRAVGSQRHGSLVLVGGGNDQGGAEVRKKVRQFFQSLSNSENGSSSQRCSKSLCVKDVQSDARRIWELGKEFGATFQGNEEDVINKLVVLEQRDARGAAVDFAVAPRRESEVDQ
ncbi:uncharacterized protein LOC130731284 [Lotus japonicus]|uniref:uncharacterized protein LOC130731284 n=1 Tax=Lotus japonicus TaxID=34305 RepID=UPI002582E5C0|nr:uncharacterized protein LOC130731284 [Lotus japonicus]